MKKFRLLAGLILFTLVAGIFGNLSPVLADGIIAPPYDYPVYETAQKGFIIYDDGVEILVLTAVFEGSAQDFGWIVPVPNKPEVENARVDIFEDLADMTMPQKSLLDKVMYPEDDYYYPMGGYGGVMEMAGSLDEPRSTVVVHEEKSVGIFSVAVLTAEKVEDLEEWLDDNGYQLPEPGVQDEVWIQNSELYDNDYYNEEEIMMFPEPLPPENPIGINRSRVIIQNYIDSEWFFVAVKVDNRFIDNANADITGRGGEINPLRFTFRTSDIVYPMRITSLSNRGIDTTIYTLTDEKVWVSNYDSRGACWDGDYYQSDYDFEKIENYCSDFNMMYGSIVSPDEIEDLTKDVGKGSWYKPDRKMYLSKHVSSYLMPESMTADVLFEDVGGTSGLNDGSMSMTDWIKLPFVFVLYAPRNLVTGIMGSVGYIDGGFGLFAIVAMMIGGMLVSAVVAFVWYLILKRTRSGGVRILWYVLQFPSVWLFSLLAGISITVLLALFGVAIGLHEEVAVIDAMLLGDKLALLMALVFYRFQWKDGKLRRPKTRRPRSESKK